MLRYTTDRARPGLVALYDIRPGNGVGQFLQLQPRSPHGAGSPGVAVKTERERERAYFFHRLLQVRLGPP